MTTTNLQSKTSSLKKKIAMQSKSLAEAEFIQNCMVDAVSHVSFNVG